VGHAGRQLRPDVPGDGARGLGAHERRQRFEVLFRFYGPEKLLFEKTWRLPDIEKV